MKRLNLIIMILILVLISSNLIHAQIVLSEIMFDPEGSEHTDEFVEIFNTGLESVNLTGWRIGDGSGDDAMIDAGEGLILQPDQYAVILDADYFEQSIYYDLLIPESALILTVEGSTIGSAGLSNSRDEIVTVINPSGEIVCQYSYSIGNTPGHSDEKIDLNGLDVEDNWAESRVENGTPGFQNSVARLRFDLNVTRLWSEPEVPVYDEEATLQAMILNCGSEMVSGFTVRFFQDANKDSLFGEDKMIDFVTYSDPLLSGDSIGIQIDWYTPESGFQTIGVQIEFNEDERPEDNQRLETVIVGFQQATLVINEIMFDPLSGQPEWVELFNRSGQSVDLQRWHISDSDTLKSSEISDKSIFIPSNEFAVIAEDSSFISLTDCVYLVPEKFPDLNNDEDAVVLFDPSKKVIDRVDYQCDWGGENGVSLERIHPDFNSNMSSNWHACTDIYGMTMGDKNSVYTEFLTSEASMTVTPNPFSPDEDGYEDIAVISYRIPSQTAYVNCRVYDVRGRCVRHLRGASVSGPEGIIAWDGKDDEGRLSRLGIYIVFLEALNSTEGKVMSSKTTVVLAGDL